MDHKMLEERLRSAQIARTRVDLHDVRQRIAAGPSPRPNHVRGVLRLAVATALACALSVATSGLVSRNIAQIAQPETGSSSIAAHDAAEAFVQWRLRGLQMLEDDDLQATPERDTDPSQEPSGEGARGSSSRRGEQRQHRECARRQHYV